MESRLWSIRQSLMLLIFVSIAAAKCRLPSLKCCTVTVESDDPTQETASDPSPTSNRCLSWKCHLEITAVVEMRDGCFLAHAGQKTAEESVGGLQSRTTLINYAITTAEWLMIWAMLPSSLPNFTFLVSTFTLSNKAIQWLAQASDISS